jgi:hypothetical protein
MYKFFNYVLYRGWRSANEFRLPLIRQWRTKQMFADKRAVLLAIYIDYNNGSVVDPKLFVTGMDPDTETDFPKSFGSGSAIWH